MTAHRMPCQSSGWTVPLTVALFALGAPTRGYSQSSASSAQPPKVPTQAQPRTKWSISTGTHWLSGRYGSTEKTYLRASPVTCSWQRGAWKLKAGTSWVSISGPGSLSDGEVVSSNAADADNDTSRSESGVGDTNITATWQRQKPWLNRLWLDASVSAKLPTADEEKGLGTGATDYRVKLDLAQRWGKLTGFATLGYKFRGDSRLRPLDNAPWATTGISVPCRIIRGAGKQGCGLLYDHTWPAVDSNAARTELTTYWQLSWSQHWSTLLYVTGGFNADSADAGAGLQLKYRLHTK